MTNTISIVVYHYVREIKKSRFPGIKGLETSLFKEQVAFLRKNYKLITMEDLIDAIESQSKLPENSAILTFDDSYSDHFSQVFPILKKWGIQGSFYIPSQMITENRVLNVNKIHFILALSSNKRAIIKKIFEEVDKIRREIPLPDSDSLFQMHAIPHLNDCGEIMLIKRMLQKVIPQPYRNQLIDELFRDSVRMDEESFSKELYMCKDQLEYMASSGMHLGNHTYSHPWLNLLSRKEQEEEISKCSQFLSSIGVNENTKTMCYPHGGYNSDTIEVIKSMGFKLALTVSPGVARINSNNAFQLNRIDTNDITTEKFFPRNQKN
jgi:peptidoglycan/xylan/chitin deacetylase (PgdA/CDA1 family)